VLGGIGQGASIELPHLVYALVDRVEVDIMWMHYEMSSSESDECDSAPVHLRYVSPGIEVMRVTYRDDIKVQTHELHACKTLAADVKVSGRDRPCSHVTVGISGLTRVQAVRVFGRAIVF
jgi:hypothetical protein